MENGSNTDACLNDCQRPSCGDGFVRAGLEACDDGINQGGNGGCLPGCSGIQRCGDAETQGSETCDDGITMALDPTPASRDAPHQRAAAMGTSMRARRATMATTVGDKAAASLVACASNTAATASSTATKNATTATETTPTDAPTNATQATCGDGVVWVGVEQCDDANNDDEDGCSTLCTLPSCGDGVVDAEFEECDDGNRDDQDGCLSSCTLAYCGDGVVQLGVEACDRGTAEADECATPCDEGATSGTGDANLDVADASEGGGGCSVASGRKAFPIEVLLGVLLLWVRRRAPRR